MSDQMMAEPTEAFLQQKDGSGWRNIFYSAENLLITLALAMMMVLPLAEIVLRKFFHTGISGSTSFVQHLTLMVGMLGGAIAARENRLLSFAALETFLKGRWKTIIKIFCGSVATAITVFLCVASIQFVQSEKAIPVPKILAYSIPYWAIETIMPIGFAAVALRIIYHASENWRGRGLTILLAGLLIWMGVYPPLPSGHLLIPAFILLLIAAILGIPIFATLGGTALIFFWGNNEPIASIPIDHLALATNSSLPTVPLFILAGYFLAEGGASKRLIRVFQALFGQFRGGPAIVTALVCAFFTTFTGGSGVTILALGGLLLPVLLAARYSERDALGLLTGAGSLGLLFPPCLPLILYAIIAKI